MLIVSAVNEEFCTATVLVLSKLMELAVTSTPLIFAFPCMTKLFVALRMTTPAVLLPATLALSFNVIFSSSIPAPPATLTALWFCSLTLDSKVTFFL